MDAMRGHRTHGRLWPAVAAAAAAAALAVGCDVGGGSDADAEGPAPAAEVGELRYDELRVAYDNAIDYVDPGLSYTVLGLRILVPVHLGLVTYRHESGPAGAELIPALAEELPEVTEDGRTYMFRLREGRSYSDGTPIRASDFARTIERLFRLDSPGAAPFRDLVGAPQFARELDGGIRGIVTDDAERTIRITLREPRADFLHVLATTFAALVPPDTPAEDRSTEGIPASGPYVVDGYTPNEVVALVRNPEWQPIDGVPDGNPDRITFRLIADDEEALDAVLDGESDYTAHPIPAERLESVRAELGERVKVYTPANTYYFFLNTRRKPFDKLAARQAVNHAIDRAELVRLFDGLAHPTQNVLPPTYREYEELSLYPHDLEKARELVRSSGYRNTAVTVWTSSRPTLRTPAEYLVRVLRQIGFRANLRALDPGVYLPTIGDARTGAQAGVANWFHDYPHPLNWFDTLLNGERITPEYNYNYSYANVPAINREIEELRRRPASADSAVEEWKALDRMVMQQALWAPIVNRRFTDVFGEDMDVDRCYVSHVVYEFLFTTSCKAG